MPTLRCPKCTSHIDHDDDKGPTVECPKCRLLFNMHSREESFDPTRAEPNVAAVDPYSPEGWRIDCEQITFFAGSLLQLATRKASMTASIEVIRCAPHSVVEWCEFEKLASEALRENSKFSTHPSLFVRLTVDGCRLSNYDRDSLNSVLMFWKGFAEMTPERRDLLEAGIVGTIFGFLTA